MDSNKKTFEMEKNILYDFSTFIASIVTGILLAVKSNSKKLNLQRGGRVESVPASTSASTPTSASSVPASTSSVPASTSSVPVSTPATKKENLTEPDGWMQSFFAVVDIINKTLLNSVNNLAIKTVDGIVQHTLGDLGKDPKETILDKLNYATNILSQMANDPEVQEALTGLSQQLTAMSLQTLETVQPQINQILEKAVDTLNQTANKSAKGLMDSGMNFVTSLIGNIPVYGGIVSIVMAFLRGFNDAAYAASPGVKLSSDSFVTAFNTALKMIQDFNEAANALGQKIDIVSTAVRGLSTSAASIPTSIKSPVSVPVLPVPVPTLSKSVPVPTLSVPVPTLSVPVPKSVPALPVPKQKGGAKLHKRINHITRRLKKTIHRFINNKKFTRKV